MNQRANEVRDRIMKRKNNQLKNLRTETNTKSTYQYGDVEFTKSEELGNEKKLEGSSVVFRLLISILLVSCMAILFQIQQKPFETIQDKVTHIMEKEFQFAVVSNWYESKFGEPLTFLNVNNKLNDESEVIQTSGKVLESFQVNGQGIVIESSINSVESFGEGLVIFAGEKEDLGQTIIVQNVDGSETWYGKLDTISVNVYDEVKKGDIIANSNSENGTYYVAMKKNESFIDPNQVISFE